MRISIQKGSLHWLNIVIVIMLTMFGIAFATSNLGVVHVSFLHLSTFDAPLYLPIFMAFFMGVVGGILSLFFSRQKHKKEIERLQKENSLLKQEVENLRNIPLQDDV